jgi:hypothetical protein
MLKVDQGDFDILLWPLLGGGSVSSLMVSLAGRQIFDVLVLCVTGDNRIPIKCAVGRLNFQQGNVAFNQTLLDLHGAVMIQGKRRLPQASLGRVILIPTPVFGNAKDAPCAGLTQQLLSAP